MKEILTLLKKYWAIVVIGTVLVIGSIFQSSATVTAFADKSTTTTQQQQHQQQKPIYSNFKHSSQIASYSIHGIRGYGDLEAVKVQIVYLLKEAGIPEPRVYIKADRFDGGVNEEGESYGSVYTLDSISIFTTTAIKDTYSDLIKEIIYDNIDGGYTVKIHGNLNVGLSGADRYSRN